MGVGQISVFGENGESMELIEFQFIIWLSGQESDIGGWLEIINLGVVRSLNCWICMGEPSNQPWLPLWRSMKMTTDWFSKIDRI